MTTGRSPSSAATSVAAESRILEAGLAQLYAQALVAITRADHQIELEEGLRLQQRIEHAAGCRCPSTICCSPSPSIRITSPS